jgi:outer membrane protein assembly factor BamD
MFRKTIIFVLLTVLALAAVGCRKNTAQNPLADLDSKQPDKALFDRAMSAMDAKKWDVARLTLQTLINTYPDSEYVARAKLAVGDAWYREGGSAGLAQAEIEYKDFITFFPHMAEAAEAQLKVANIHYRQMEKPDRDFMHAKRAEEEYKQLLLQFPDSTLVPDAKLRLLEVQEVLAEREFRIGRFYFLRESWAASIGRLKSVADTYPLYSGADETLFLLGQANEREADMIGNSTAPDLVKEKLGTEFRTAAADAYSRIVTRYPATARAIDAAQRLDAMNFPVPAATPEAIQQNQTEIASRGESGKIDKILQNFRKGPDVAAATKVGEPTMVEPRQTSATDVIKQAEAALGGIPKPEEGAPAEAGEVPDRAIQPAGDAEGGTEIEVINNEQAPQANEATPGSNRPWVEGQGAKPAETEQTTQTEEQQTSSSTTVAEGDDKDDKKNTSSSKKKKKKGLRKLIPF